jgi:hypothetical protein
MIQELAEDVDPGRGRRICGLRVSATGAGASGDCVTEGWGIGAAYRCVVLIGEVSGVKAISGVPGRGSSRGFVRLLPPAPIGRYSFNGFTWGMPPFCRSFAVAGMVVNNNKPAMVFGMQVCLDVTGLICGWPTRFRI